MTDRTPCINPKCRRTFRRDGSNEIICGKCFRCLPEEDRNRHRRFWRNIRKFDRRIKRTSDALTLFKLRRIRDIFSRMLNDHWEVRVRPFFLTPTKPEGLDTFLEEIGL